MDSLRIERQQIQQLVAQQLGRNRRNPMQERGQLRSDGLLGDIEVLPVDKVVSLNVTDPTSPNFGRARFIAGISRLDGSDVLE